MQEIADERSRQVTRVVPLRAYLPVNVASQGCGVWAGVGVGVARSRGNEPGVGVGVGADQTTSTPTPERLFNLWYNSPMQGRIRMHFLEIICAVIVF